MQCIGLNHIADLHDDPAPTMCSPCEGLTCATCGVTGLVIKPGWSRSSTAEAVTSTPWFAFKCPGAEEACVQDGQSRCRQGHAGLLCNECMAGYGMVDESCTECNMVSKSPVLTVVAVLAVIIGAGLAYYFCCVRQSTTDDDPSALQIQLTDNPLQPNFSPQEGRLSRSGAAVQRSADAVMLARVVYQPFRILVGYMQVITQIGTVLEFDLPPRIQSVIDSIRFLAMNLKGFFQLDCLGGISFYDEWLVRVLVIPFALVGLVSLRYSFEKRRGEAADAAGKAAKDAATEASLMIGNR